MKKAINSKKAPGAIGPYSQAIEAGGMVFVSGQLPINAETGEMAQGVGDVVKTTVFLEDMSLFGEMNEVYATYFEAPFPARSAVAVDALPRGASVEIECIAVR